MPKLHSIAEQFMDRTWNKKDLSAIDEIAHPQIVVHSLLGEFQGVEPLKKIVETWLAGFPDMSVEIESIMESSNVVMVQWTAYGTHSGEFKGIKRTGKKVIIHGQTLYTLRDDKIIEYAAQLDLEKLLDSLRNHSA